MALPYWLSRENQKYYLYIKVSQPAGSTRQYTIEKDSSKSPDTATSFWDFYEDFSGDSLDTNVWDDSNVPSGANYSVSNGTLNMWNNWGGCCNGSCYYDSIETNQTFNLPVLIRLAGNQENYQAVSGCGRTGPTIKLGSSVEIITSTDTNDNQGINLRINNSRFSNNGIKRMPDLYPENFGFTANISQNGVQLRNFWDNDFDNTTSVSTTTNLKLGLSGDTDQSSVIDHIDYIALSNSTKTHLPSVTIISQSTDSMLIEVDDSASNDGIDLNNQIVILDVTGFVESVTEGLNIYSSNVYILFNNISDNTVYYWDGSNWQTLNKSKDDLTQSDFSTYGSLNIVEINKSQWDSLNSQLEVLAYSDTDSGTATTTVQFRPYKRAVIQSDPIILQDYSTIKSMTFEYNGNGNNSEKEISVIISRDNQNWYSWNGSDWNSLGTRTLDYNNDVDWIFNNGVEGTDYNNVPQSKWEEFFGNTNPDYIYFAFSINYDNNDANVGLDTIVATVDINGYLKEDTINNEVKLTENTLTIKFNSVGEFFINYID